MESDEVAGAGSVQGNTEKTPQKEIEEEQIQDDFDSGSFSSVVNYPYNFAEVAFLVYKLYQLIDRKFELKQRVLTLRRFVQRWRIRRERSKMSEREHNMKFILDIENITRMQELQLNLGKVHKKLWKIPDLAGFPRIIWNFPSLFLSPSLSPGQKLSK